MSIRHNKWLRETLSSLGNEIGSDGAWHLRLAPTGERTLSVLYVRRY